MKLHFTKIQGIGNDYIYFNCLEKELDNPGNLSKKLSDRHLGVGADGMILILPSEKADFRMRMFNADGSEAEMCGNGIRGFAKYVYDKKITTKEELQIETKENILTLKLDVEDSKIKSVEVDMGEPILKGKDIPVNIDKDKVINEPISVNNKTYKMTCVSMSNPHCIIYVDNITDDHIHKIGPIIENHELFPSKVNVEFIKVINENEVQMRVWERGSGETLACGTGATAVCVAGVLTEKTKNDIIVHLPGGDLKVEWKDDNHVYMTGPTEIVFEGEVEI